MLILSHKGDDILSYKKSIATTCLSVLILLSLSGCVSNENNLEKSALKIQQMYSGLSEFETDVKFLCDSGQSILEYDCEFEYNKEYGQTLTIKNPDSLSGIVINSTGTSKDNLNISYGDTVLDFDVSAQLGTSPANFMPTFITTLTNSVSNDIWEETQGNQKLLVARYETNTNDKPMTSQIWLYKDTLLPMYAEVYTDGERVLQVFFSGFNAS